MYKQKLLSLIIALLIGNVVLAQTIERPKNNCSSLREKGENYGVGNDNKSYCDFEKQTPYVSCQCKWENALKRYEEQINSIKKEISKLSLQSQQANDNENNAAKKGNNIWNNLANDDPEFNTKKNEALTYLKQALSYAEEGQGISKNIEKLRNQIYGSDSSNSSKVSNVEEYKYTIGQIESRTQTKKIKISSNSEDSRNNYSSSNSNQTSNNTNSENIYDKKQREAREKEKKKQDNYNKGIEYLDKIEKSKKRLDASIKQNDKDLNTFFDNQFAKSNAITARKNAEKKELRKKIIAEEKERKKKIEIEKERKKKVKEKKEKLELIKKEKERKLIEDTNYFYRNTLIDHKMPILVKKNELFFFIALVKIYPSKPRSLSFATFSLKANNQMQLPYKNKVIENFKKTNKQNSSQHTYLYGPYNSKNEQLQIYNDLKSKAKILKINLTTDIDFHFKQSNVKTEPNLDFWGNKKEKTTKKKKAKKDFWN